MFLLWATGINAQVTEFSYYFDHPKTKISGSNQTINFDNTMLFGRPGEPLLPYQKVNLLIPPGHEAVGISVTGSDQTELPGFYKLTPAPYSRPVSAVEDVFSFENEDIYLSREAYPELQHGNLSTQYMNGFAFAQTVITPVIYIPSQGKISYYKKITILIETRETDRGRNALNNLSASPTVRKNIYKTAQNPSIADLYNTPRASVNDYQILIISPQTFAELLGQLTQLYLPRGLKSQFASIESIQANSTGADLPEKIRNYIITQYQQFGIEHVVLAGDVEHVPYRGLYCTVQSSSVYTDDNIPSDLYFSSLDGNWNTNGNGWWGEIGEDDLLPEISVGRMSFSNINELNAMLNKTIKYQNQPVVGELRNPLLAGENLYDNPETWGSDYMELLIGTHNDNGYTTTGIPEDHNLLKLYDEISNWSPSVLMAAINSGRNFIHHSGHANDTYVMKLYNSDITNSNFSGVNGVLHNFPVVYTHGCICGSFDTGDCIAEKMVSINNFASAFVGNSRYGWFNEGQTEGPSAHLHREFTDALFTDSLNRIGRAHMESKIETAPWVNAPGQWEEGALRWCFYDCNVLGDPAMAIWTDEPIEISVAYPASLTTGTMQFDVTITSEGMPAKGLTAALIMDGILYGKGISDNNGLASVTLDPLITVPGEAQLVISGYNCLPAYYPIVFISGNSPYVVYHSHELIDTEGNNNGQADYGETITLSLTMQNIGLSDASNVSVTIACNSPYVTITDDNEIYGLIVAQGTVTSDGFGFIVSPDIPDNQLIEFSIVAEAEGVSWSSSFQITALAPEISAGPALVSDINGNNNGVPDPGETISMGITILNNGGSASLPVTGTLTCDNALVNTGQNTAGPQIVVPGSQIVFDFTDISVSPAIPVGTPLIFTLSLTVNNPPQTVLQQDYVFVAGQIIEDFESGSFLNHPWVNGGNASWSIANNDPFEGSYSARSGLVGNNQKSELSVSYNVMAADSISFYLKVSSETDYDFLKFYVDETVRGQWSGEKDWMRAGFSVTPGTHIFKWVYAKDISVTSGTDAAWIDYIVFPPVEIVVGVDEMLSSDGSMHLFPNPARSAISLFTGKTAPGSSLLMKDVSGRTIKEIHTVAPDQLIEIDLSGIRPGIYFIMNPVKATSNTLKLIIL